MEKLNNFMVSRECQMFTVFIECRVFTVPTKCQVSTECQVFSFIEHQVFAVPIECQMFTVSICRVPNVYSVYSDKCLQCLYITKC